MPHTMFNVTAYDSFLSVILSLLEDMIDPFPVRRISAGSLAPPVWPDLEFNEIIPIQATSVEHLITYRG